MLSELHPKAFLSSSAGSTGSGDTKKPVGSADRPTLRFAMPVLLSPSQLAFERRAYPSSAKTEPVDALAWARAAMPLWFRMLNRVRLADSSAMFASRIRLSAARLFTTWFRARPIAKFRRF